MSNRRVLLSIIGVLILIASVVGLTYSWFSVFVEGIGKPIVVTAGILDIKYEETETMNVIFAEPIYDDNRGTQHIKMFLQYPMKREVI